MTRFSFDKEQYGEGDKKKRFRSIGCENLSIEVNYVYS